MKGDEVEKVVYSGISLSEAREKIRFMRNLIQNNMTITFQETKPVTFSQPTVQLKPVSVEFVNASDEEDEYYQVVLTGVQL